MKNPALVFALAAAPLFAQPVDQGQRDFALSALHASRKAFLDSIAGLSEAQWKFKPAPDRWSIAECAEHAILTEERLFGLEQKTMQSPAVADRKIDRAADEAILKQVTDRSQKAKNPPEVAPTGRYATPKEAAQAFRERRDQTLDYIRTTQDALRSHTTSFGPSTMDAYQLLLIIAGHTDRHVGQIKEVKAAAGYPAK
ncbi:MAG: DinB family protein [Acidobacteriota bacterium]